MLPDQELGNILGDLTEKKAPPINVWVLQELITHYAFIKEARTPAGKRHCRKVEDVLQVLCKFTRGQVQFLDMEFHRLSQGQQEGQQEE